MAFKGKKLNRKFSVKNFANKERSVDIEAIALKIKLTTEDFNSIKRKIAEKELK
jgi:hypothetical protein